MTTREFIDNISAETIEEIKKVGKDPEKVYAVAKAAGLTDSFEDFQTVLQKKYDEASEGLSEEELENVAGGGLTGAGCNPLDFFFCG